MTKEEKIIRRLRRRSPGIIAGVILLVMMSAALAFTIRQSMKVDALVTPERIRTMASFESPKSELPELFCRFHTLAGISSKLMIYAFYFAMLVGLALGWLIIQIADISRRCLFISMWDRIQKLEQEMEELKANSQ